MLTKEDLQNIGTIVDEKIEKRLTAFGDVVDEKIRGSEHRVIEKMTTMVGEMVEQNVIPSIDEIQRTMADRDFIIRQIEKATDPCTLKHRTNEKKVNLLIAFLREQRILTEQQLAELRAMKLFPDELRAEAI